MTQTSTAPAQRPNIRTVDVIANKAAGVTLRSLPHLPDRIKRLLLGGRSITLDGNTLDVTLQLMLAGQRMMGLDGLVGDDDHVTARAQLEMLAASFAQRIPVTAVTDLDVPGAAGAIRARHYRAGDPDAPLLVFFHGGGHVMGSLDTHDDLCRQICRAGGMHVLSVDYRLAPEHPAPAGAEDAYAAYCWARDHAAELGADPARIAVGGDSASANLSALVALRSRDEQIQPPDLQVLLYPVTDYTSQTRSKTLFARGFFLTRHDIDWFSARFLGGSRLAGHDPQVSPLLVGDLSGLPPALVVTAGFDPLRDEGRQYAEAMRAAGTAVDYREFGSVVHGFANFFTLGGDSATVTAEVISAIRAHLTRAG